MNKKYALYPGYVLSESDGEIHFISAMQLTELYGIDIKKCIVIDYNKPETYAGINLSEYILLGSRRGGNYELPLLPDN